MKNLAWFEKFESKKFDRIYYVEGNHVYYDLLVLVDEPKHSRDTFKYLALPVPIFTREKMGEEITGKEINFGKEKRWDIQDYLHGIDIPLLFFSRDEYHDLVRQRNFFRKGLNCMIPFLMERKPLLIGYGVKN